MQLCNLFSFVLTTLVVGIYGTRNDSVYDVQALRARLGSKGTKSFKFLPGYQMTRMKYPNRGVDLSR